MTSHEFGGQIVDRLARAVCGFGQGQQVRGQFESARMELRRNVRDVDGVSGLVVLFARHPETFHIAMILGLINEL